MSKGRTQSKLARFLERFGGRYKWVGNWPAIPVALRAYETPPRKTATTGRVVTCHIEEVGGPITHEETIVEVPPDAPPAWVEKIYENLFEKILPPKKGMSVEFHDAAIYGYAFSAIQRERIGRLEARKSLPPESEQRQVHEELAKIYEPALDLCRNRVAEVLAGWKLPEVGDYLKGFAYGIECQHREESWTPSATTESLQIYKALLRNQGAVKSLTKQNATAKEIGEYIASKAVKGDGMTYAEYFEVTRKAAMKRETEPFQRTSSRMPVKQGGESDKAHLDFLKFFQKICGDIGIPLPPRGRPRRNSPGV